MKTLNEDDEKTLVRMVTSLSKGANTNNEINTDTLNSFFDKYVGVGGVNVNANTSDLLQVQFNKSGNSYDLDVFKGILDFIQGDRYTIKYDANGGILLAYIQTAEQGEQIKLTEMKPTRAGYTFLGWSTSSSATTAEYVAGDTYTVNESVTLYAVWTESTSNSYIITYNANGGTGAPNPQTATRGQSITISSQIPTREGYIFKGWAITSFLPVAQYQAGDVYTGSANVTLYAIWGEEAAQYTITFNANGGTGGPTSLEANENENITLPTTTPTRDGYTFLGWNESSTATSPQYAAGGTYRGNSDITLYAVWNINYTITFNANGGTGGPGTVTAASGTTITIPTTQPTKDGYTFVGWATSSSATTADYSVGSEYTVSGNKTLYAVWSSNTWTITYNANGGTFGSETTTTQSVTKGQSTAIISTVPTRDGYTFLGWATSSTATTASYASGATITPSSNMTLYAVWEEVEVQTYTVTFTKPTTWYMYTVSNLPDSITVTSGGSITIPDVTPTCSSYFGTTTYTFAGWATSYSSTPNGTTAEYSIGDTISNITSNTTLYPVFTSN